jgi:hypothetical protein
MAEASPVTGNFQKVLAAWLQSHGRSMVMRTITNACSLLGDEIRTISAPLEIVGLFTSGLLFSGMQHMTRPEVLGFGVVE